MKTKWLWIIGALAVIVAGALVYSLVIGPVEATAQSRLQDALLTEEAFGSSMTVKAVPQDRLIEQLESEGLGIGDSSEPIEPAICEDIRQNAGQISHPNDAAGVVASAPDGSVIYLEMLMQTRVEMDAVAETVIGECATVSSTIKGRPVEISYQILPTDIVDSLVLKQVTTEVGSYSVQARSVSEVLVGYVNVQDVLLMLTQITVGGIGDQTQMTSMLSRAVEKLESTLTASESG